MRATVSTHRRSLIYFLQGSFKSLPSSSVVLDPQDRTEISWKVSLQEGKALEAEGKSIQVKHSGIYSIYSQVWYYPQPWLWYDPFFSATIQATVPHLLLLSKVFYTDTTYTMGHIILRKANGNSEDSDILLKCVQSMPGIKTLAFNTCYTSGKSRVFLKGCCKTGL